MVLVQNWWPRKSANSQQPMPNYCSQRGHVWFHWSNKSLAFLRGTKNDGLASKNGGLTMFNLTICDWDFTSQKGTYNDENYGFHQEQHEYVYMNTGLPWFAGVLHGGDISWHLLASGFLSILGQTRMGTVWLKHESPMGPHNCHFDPFWVLINRWPFYLTG